MCLYKNFLFYYSRCLFVLLLLFCLSHLRWNRTHQTLSERFINCELNWTYNSSSVGTPPNLCLERSGPLSLTFLIIVNYSNPTCSTSVFQSTDLELLVTPLIVFHYPLCPSPVWDFRYIGDDGT